MLCKLLSPVRADSSRSFRCADNPPDQSCHFSENLTSKLLRDFELQEVGKLALDQKRQRRFAVNDIIDTQTRFNAFHFGTTVVQRCFILKLKMRKRDINATQLVKNIYLLFVFVKHQ